MGRGVNLTRVAASSSGEHGMEGRRGRDILSSAPGDAACAPAPYPEVFAPSFDWAGRTWLCRPAVPRRVRRRALHALRKRRPLGDRQGEMVGRLLAAAVIDADQLLEAWQVSADETRKALLIHLPRLIGWYETRDDGRG